MMIGAKSAKDPATVVIAINIIDMTTDKKLEYYREKHNEIGTLIERLKQREDYREALLEAIDRNLPAALGSKTNIQYLSKPIPMSEDLAHKVRIMMIENLEKEIEILHNTITDKLA